MGLSLAKTVFVRLINVSKGYILNLGPLGPLLHVKKTFTGVGGWEQRPLIWGGWLEKVRIRLTSASTGVGVEVEAELGNITTDKATA